MHIIFSCILVHPRNFTQLKDPRRELEISLFSYLSSLKFGKEDHLIYLFHLQLFFQYQKKSERGNNMTFPKLGKNEDLMNESSFGFAGVLLRFFIGKNARFQKNCILGPEKSSFCSAHFRSRGKFTLDFSEFV